MNLKTTLLRALAVAAAATTLAATGARADVKNVWVGVNGATCPT